VCRRRVLPLIGVLGLAACDDPRDPRAGIDTPCQPTPAVGQDGWREVHHDAGSFRLPARFEYDTTVTHSEGVTVRYKAGEEYLSLQLAQYALSTAPSPAGRSIGYQACRATIGGRTGVVVSQGFGDSGAENPLPAKRWHVSGNWGRVQRDRYLYLSWMGHDSTLIPEAIAIVRSVRLPAKWHDTTAK
jgi:hypothetical protein